MARRFVFLCLVAVFASVMGQQRVVEKDSGYLGSCPLGILDVTFSTTSTDALKVLLVGDTLDYYNSYNISRAATLTDDKIFRKNFKTVLYVHGFYDKPSASSSAGIVEAYHKRGGYNILLVDARGYASLEYLRSARSVRYMGIRLGNLIARLAKTGLDVRKLELVGHSLGAHVVGQIGKTYFKVTKKRLPKIVGLDPSGVCFRSASKDDRLDKGDADFVQVMHTNGGELGLVAAVGHIDFYLNGGRRQPGPLGIFCLLACSHNRAIEYWRFAVLFPKKFVGVKCDSVKQIDEMKCELDRKSKKAIMGPEADPKIGGIYYLRTDKNEPYFIEEPDFDYERFYYHYHYHYKWK